MQLRVLRGIGLNSRVLKLGDRELPRGATFDSSEFPEVASADWDRWKSHRFVEEVGRRDDAKAAAARRQQRELARARAEVAPVDTPDNAVVEAKPARTCPGCGGPLVKKNPNGPGRYPKVCSSCRS